MTLPIPPPLEDRKQEAARLLEQAIKAGLNDPQAAYFLARCYFDLGRTGEARQALHRLSKLDGASYQLLGLLSLAEKNPAQAEQDFSNALEQEPSSFPAGFNLFLTRLLHDRLSEACALLPRLRELAPNPEEGRFLYLLEAFLAPVSAFASNGSTIKESPLQDLSESEEQRILRLLAGLDHFEVSYPLLCRLAQLRPHSPHARQAALDLVLFQARQLMDLGQWEEARGLLAPFGRAAVELEPAGKYDRAGKLTLLNLLGCCAFTLEDPELATWYFLAALKWAPNDTCLHQNLALAFENRGKQDQADVHWNRFLDLLNSQEPARDPRLAFETLNRLAEVHTRQENWKAALNFLQRAHRLVPTDADCLERLFHLYVQSQRLDEARKSLRRLREIKPNEPQYELFELDLRDLKTAEDLERLLSEIRRVVSRHPGDLRVEDRAQVMVAHLVPTLERHFRQLAEQTNKVTGQMGRLPSYQVNWPAVREVMRDLEEELTVLRRSVTKALQLVSAEETRRLLRELADKLERKIEMCHSIGS